MKTKLLFTVAILFFAIFAKSQAIVRPPINTESIFLTNWIWENDSIMKDSLYYIRFDNERCFSIKGLYAGDEWEQMCFAADDSIYIDSLDIWICNNCYIVTDTTNFFVKRSSCNYNCWTYSYDGVIWLPWFCLPEIEPETKLYIFAKDSNLLNVYHRLYYNDSDSIGYKNNSHYIDKWLYYGVDSIYWRQSPDSLFKGGIWYSLPDTIPNDSLFMDGVWYSLPDTLPINVDSLIYVNNVPISVGDSINTHDCIYYNGEWVMNDTIHIVDNSIVNELDSFYYSGSWIKNGMTLTVPAIPSLYYTINGVPYFNQSAITINESKWDYDTYGIHNNSMFMSTVGVGFASQKWVRLYVDGLGDDKGAIYAHSIGDWAISGESDTGGGVFGKGDAFGVYGTSVNGTGGAFASDSSLGIRADSDNDFAAYFYSPLGMVTNKINIGSPLSVAYSLPIADGDSLQTLFTDGHGNLTFGNSGATTNLYFLPDSVWKNYGDTVNYYWDIYTDIFYDNIYTNKGVAIGTSSSAGSKLKVVGNDSYSTIYASQTSTGYSGQFTGGAGLKTDKLTVGDSTVTQIRSMATFTIWQGTQAAYDAIGTKDAKTIYYIEQNFNIIQILFFLLMFFGSKGVFGQSDWANVYVGSTEMKKIYVGDKLVWEKQVIDTTLIITMQTTSTASNWSPQNVTKTGATLRWVVTGGGASYDVNINKPTFDFSGTSGTKDIKVYSSDGASGLTELYCYSNQLTSLDVSNCLALNKLYCLSNQLTSLDVSSNANLQSLNCVSNQLTSLDVSSNTNLKYLYCYSNQLRSLDISSNTNLTVLYCHANQLTSLDVSSNTDLYVLDCASNQLTSLDISSNTNLYDLDCYSNQLRSLDISSNTNLTVLYCHANQLTTSSINDILDDLIVYNLINGKFYCQLQSPPASPDATKIATLRGRGWTVTY